MARLLVEDDDLIVRLPWWEKAAARHGDVRVPLAAVRRVRTERDWWRALRGVARRGVWISGALYAGTRRDHEEDDFVAFRPGRPVVCVEVRPGTPWRLLSVSVADPEATARWLRRRAPDLDPRGAGKSAQAGVWDWVTDRLTLWPSP
ncbi:hypothetical protein [Streptomyces marispadix]|uniref:Uncharacterized protein n=1 Tax=Streptomyces marispadix TaxID=2922868 RepID=A0ABS9T693_9ACTN|nr:hypothetical protein [Streptomyces marispadix]MCH6158861.1 hypothetical protein [Streptomyces marispadix]MCH6164044.1 hypothetical protein [Streptomyces marispadix]